MATVRKWYKPRVGWEYSSYLRYKQLVGSGMVRLIIDIRKPKTLQDLNFWLKRQSQGSSKLRATPMHTFMKSAESFNTYRLTVSFNNVSSILALFQASRRYLKIRKHGVGDLVEIEINCGHTLTSMINLLRHRGILEFDIVMINSQTSFAKNEPLFKPEDF